MKPRLLITLSAHHLTAILWRRGRVLARHDGPSDEGGRLCFSTWLAAYEAARADLLVDVAEEDYRAETLPHARGRARRELLARKLKQHYRSTPYCAAIWRSRERSGRRDDTYELMALTRPELLAPWLALLEHSAIPLAGIYPLAIVGARLARKLKLRAPHALLVAATSAGVRTSYFRDGEFALTRLTASGARRSALEIGDIANTRLYLQAIHAAALDEPLSVVVLDPLDELPHAEADLRAASPALECIRIGSRDLRSRLGLNTDDAVTADVLYLHLLALGSPSCNLAPSEATVAHRQSRLRRHTYAATAVLACAVAAWSGYALHALSATATLTRAIMQERMRYEREYGEAQSAQPAMPIAPSLLREVVELEARIRRTSHTPERYMTVVSRTLSAFPDIVLTELTWSARRAAGTANSATPNDAGQTSAALEDAPVAGEVHGETSGHAGAAQTVRAFADRLSGDPAVREVRIARLPVRADPALAVSGHTRDGVATEAARFVIELAVRSDP